MRKRNARVNKIAIGLGRVTGQKVAALQAIPCSKTNVNAGNGDDEPSTATATCAWSKPLIVKVAKPAIVDESIQ